METILFEEVQYFKKKWIWILSGLLFLILVLMIVGFEAERKDSRQPTSIITMVSLLILPVGIFLLFYFARLQTQITERGISFRFSPFNRKFRFIPFSEIEKIYVREFSPLGEYGGWGLRYTLGEKAYIISGKQGIQIVLKSGKKILLTTLKQEEAEKALLLIQKSEI